MSKATISVEGTEDQVMAFIRSMITAMDALKADGHEFEVTEYMIENDHSQMTMQGKGS